jgi:2-aminoethylphosphonate-pyruvate transaminase
VSRAKSEEIGQVLIFDSTRIFDGSMTATLQIKVVAPEETFKMAKDFPVTKVRAVNSPMSRVRTEAEASVPAARDKLLFTPGPLTTSLAVKQRMLHDAGSWHFEFNEVVARIRNGLLQIAGLTRDTGWEAILMQGSGTFGVEAVFQTCVPPNGKVAVLANGAYGERLTAMLQLARIDHTVIRAPENRAADPAELEKLLGRDAAISHVAVVHCETTTGILNPVAQLGPIVKAHKKIFVVDAMSSFAGMPIDFEACGIDYLISSANKCVEGVPGFSFVLCRRDALKSCEGFARSLSLDLLAQLKGFDKNGQFRYTPPTHAILAFEQALRELELENGITGRAARYSRNHETLLREMGRLGIRPYLDAAVQSHIITAFCTPEDQHFSFDLFYRKLSERGFIIYPGKLTQVDTFRIGTIGRIFPADLEQLAHAAGLVLEEMGCKIPVTYGKR